MAHCRIARAARYLIGAATLWAGAGIEVIIPPTRVQRRAMPKNLQRLIAGSATGVLSAYLSGHGSMINGNALS